MPEGQPLLTVWPGGQETGSAPTLREQGRRCQRQRTLRDPESHSGAAVFAGPRVAVWVLFSWLAAGKTLDEFLTAHPQVHRAAVLEVLDDASRALVGSDSRGE